MSIHMLIGAHMCMQMNAAILISADILQWGLLLITTAHVD